MNKYGVIITNNGNVIDFIRCSTEDEAEQVYQENKKQMKGVVKVEIDKAHEPYVSSVSWNEDDFDKKTVAKILAYIEKNHDAPEIEEYLWKLLDKGTEFE